MIPTTMVKPHQSGPATRRAILEELRRREDACERPPTTRQLAALLGVTQPAVVYQLAHLTAAGLVERRGIGRASKPYLTAAGKIATD